MSFLTNLNEKGGKMLRTPFEKLREKIGLTPKISTANKDSSSEAGKSSVAVQSKSSVRTVAGGAANALIVTSSPVRATSLTDSVVNKALGHSDAVGPVKPTMTVSDSSRSVGNSIAPLASETPFDLSVTSDKLVCGTIMPYL